jgi:hypothetical protein
MVMVMKSSVKQGFCLLAGLFFCTVLASEPVPIEDRDAFEKEYLECFMSGLKDNCFISIFSEHLDYGFANPDELLRELNSSYLDMQKIHSPIYKIHVLDKIIRADVFDSRTYIVEYFGGTMKGLHVVFRKVKENWYVFAISMKGDRDGAAFYRILNIPGLPIE